MDGGPGLDDNGDMPGSNLSLACAALLSPLLVSGPARTVAGAAPSDWPQFRGPNGDGVAAAAHPPSEWSGSKNLAWKAALPGSGWSQPIVIGGQVYLTAAVSQGLERPLGFEQGVRDPRTMKAGQAPALEIDWRVLAFDLESGKPLWSASAAKGKPLYPVHPSNTYATETPCADASGVYAFFGATGTLAAFDPAGKPLWKLELGPQRTETGYGTASSPALNEGRVFVQCFGDDQAFLVAVDARRGSELWRVKREQPAVSWSSPLVWHNGERVELVVSGNLLITSHDPASGQELWRVAGVAGPSSCSFAADAERLYFGQRSPGANPPLYALEAGGEGDLSPQPGSLDIGHQAWMQRSAAPGMPSPVVADGLIYVLVEGILSCRDAASGELLYRERVGDLATIAASPLVVGENLLVLDEAGRAVLVRLGPDFEVVGGGQLEDVFWATPGVAGDALLLRGVDALYCVRQGG